MGQMVGYILDFEFLSSAIFVLEKNETRHFYVFKYTTHLKKYYI